MKRKIICSGHT